MGFLSPLFLLGLGAIAVPVLLHLFRRETAPDVPFAAVRYLQPTRIERQERRRIQDWLLLVLRALALAIAVMSAGCNCGDKQDGADREQVTAPDGEETADLQPLPDVPPIDVDREDLPGADGELAVVTSRPQGPVRGAVRPAVTAG